MLEVQVGSADWLDRSAITFDESGTKRILVTDQHAATSADTLVYHPQTLALGVGCERGVDPSELIQLVEGDTGEHWPR